MASCETIKKVSCGPLTLQGKFTVRPFFLFFLTEPVLSVAITHSVVFSSCHLVVNMELILCVVRSGYNVLRGSAVFWNLSGEKTNTQECSQFHSTC